MKRQRMRKLLWRRKHDNNIDLLAYLSYISFPDTQRANTLSSLIDSQRPFTMKIVEDVGGSGFESALMVGEAISTNFISIVLCILLSCLCIREDEYWRVSVYSASDAEESKYA